MTNINVMYKGSRIASFSDGNKTLETSGKYCEDNIQINVEQSQNDILFHFDNDMRNYGKSLAMITNTNGLVLSTEQHKFGTHSLKCGNSQGWNNLAIYEDLSFQSDDFTLDFWVYPTVLGSYGGNVPFSSTYRSLSLYLYPDRITLAVTHTSSSWDYDEVSGSAVLSINTWYHVAIVRSGAKIYVFLDGEKKIEINYGTNAIAKSYPFTLGSNTYDNGDRRFTGYIDEFRYIKGTAVWTSSFTPPSEPYV